MIWYIIKVTIISLSIILLAHHIMNYLIIMLTSPKIIDYVNIPQKHYENIATLMSSPLSLQLPQINNISCYSSSISDPNIQNININISDKIGRDSTAEELSEYMNSII